MSWNGSPFDAEMVNDRVEGKGKYTFPSGNIYIGEFKDGRFHGTGTIHFKSGGNVSAKWDNGVMVEGSYTFQDGLVYEPSNWDYCTQGDRRFFTERINGFLSRPEQVVNDVNGAKTIPKGGYDVGDGYYDITDDKIYEYGAEKKLVRSPEKDEREWAMKTCRIGD